MDVENYLNNADCNLLVKSPINEKVTSEGCILGIDEAGRGPVLGPMVYSSCFVPISFEETLKKLGCDDSKVLKAEQRDKLFDKLDKQTTEYVGWMVHILSAQFISNSMLGRAKYNLNAMSHDTAIGLIKSALREGVKVKKVFVDTVGPPATYQEKLQRIFPDIDITVEKKADSKYPIVSAASICAKVCRDKIIKNWKFKENADIERKYGSGYTSDVVTKAWLRRNVDRVFGFPSFVRFSWSTAKLIMEEKAVEVRWNDDDDDDAAADDEPKRKRPKREKKSFFEEANKSTEEEETAVSIKPTHWFFTRNHLSSVESL